MEAALKRKNFTKLEIANMNVAVGDTEVTEVATEAEEVTATTATTIATTEAITLDTDKKTITRNPNKAEEKIKIDNGRVEIIIKIEIKGQTIDMKGVIITKTTTVHNVTITSLIVNPTAKQITSTKTLHYRLLPLLHYQQKIVN